MAAEVLRLPAPARGPVCLYASYVYRFCPGAGRTSAKREDALGVTPCPAAVERQACKTADAAGMRIGLDVFPAASRAAAAEKKAYMRAGDACGLRPPQRPAGAAVAASGGNGASPQPFYPAHGLKAQKKRRRACAGAPGGESGSSRALQQPQQPLSVAFGNGGHPGRIGKRDRRTDELRQVAVKQPAAERIGKNGPAKSQKQSGRQQAEQHQNS